MHVYHAPEAQHIELAAPAFKSFLSDQGFKPGFIADFGIILLPRESEEEEDRIADRALVCKLVFLYVEGFTLKQLDQALLRLTRRLALGEAQILKRRPFSGSNSIRDVEQDIDRFESLASTHHFFSFSERLQPISVSY